MDRLPPHSVSVSLAVLLLAGGVVLLAQDRTASPVTDAMLRDPAPADWLLPSRTYDWQRFSPLKEITRSNVGTLQLAWVRGMKSGLHENIPLVHDGVMYVVNPGAVVQALDATNGDLLWEYQRKLPDDMRGDPGRCRNLALYEDLVIYPTPDGYLVALDVRDGRVRWETLVHDYKKRNQFTSGPIVVEGKILTGRACWIEPCFITAHDARTGKEVWRTYTATRPGEPGGDTWGNLPWEKRLNSPWGNPGSYDPQRRLVYWGVANPKPYTRIARYGKADALPQGSPAELYSNSTIALEPDTGNVAWYYQHLPGDDWDSDHVQERILVSVAMEPDAKSVKWINPRLPRGQTQDIMLTVGEPGGLFALDRAGKFLWATPFPFDTPDFHLSRVDVETGQTFINWDLVAKKDGDRSVVCFHNTKSFWPMAYDPGRNALFVPYTDLCLDSTANLKAANGADPRTGTPRTGSDPNALAGLAKVDIKTGQTTLLYKQRIPSESAVLVTAGDLVFWGDLNRRFRAFDPDTGKVLWETVLGNSVLNSTITYAVNGRQYIAVLTGQGTTADGVVEEVAPEMKVPWEHNAIYVFALPQNRSNP